MIKVLYFLISLKKYWRRCLIISCTRPLSLWCSGKYCYNPDTNRSPMWRILRIWLFICWCIWVCKYDLCFTELCILTKKNVVALSLSLSCYLTKLKSRMPLWPIQILLWHLFFELKKTRQRNEFRQSFICVEMLDPQLILNENGNE